MPHADAFDYTFEHLTDIVDRFTKESELHLLDTGHFALEEDGDEIAGYIRTFLDKQLRDTEAN